MRTLFKSALCVLMLTLTAACGFVGFPGVYKINVEQGNIIDQEKVDKLKIGMSPRQVRFILGTPLVEDSFNLNRWDYIHTIRNGNNKLLDQYLTVFFESDKLSRIEGDFTPGGTEEEAPQEATAEGSETPEDA